MGERGRDGGRDEVKGMERGGVDGGGGGWRGGIERNGGGGVRKLVKES